MTLINPTFITFTYVTMDKSSCVLCSSNSIDGLIVVKKAKTSLGEPLGTSHLDFFKPIKL
jgi:hypothetical protein